MLLGDVVEVWQGRGQAGPDRGQTEARGKDQGQEPTQRVEPLSVCRVTTDNLPDTFYAELDDLFQTEGFQNWEECTCFHEAPKKQDDLDEPDLVDGSVTLLTTINNNAMSPVNNHPVEISLVLKSIAHKPQNPQREEKFWLPKAHKGLFVPCRNW
ncbi:hypothetical protein D5F01_LYC06389 [Larimichthys crocea]|uniref:Uncharacterized protein n=1 Tax=Larimichthys crocea TaxID=215358 RepID=A0A6G0IVA9_LARCR|nr:hypothetical protein D5F01_LYC06389 [Larimichthys crocea]